MVKYLLALLLIALQVSAAYGQSQKRPTRKQSLNAEQIANAILPSVVLVSIDCDNGRTGSFGSGFFVSKNLIATNRHVVKCGTRGTIKFRDQGPQYPITSIWAVDDSSYDLAIIKVDNISAKPLPLGNGENITIGKTVYVAGNPKGLEGTFSNGIISSIRKEEGLIQFTAPISPGSSGGPLVNESGEVIGVATGFVEGQNLNFAVEIQHLSALIDQVQRGVLQPKSNVKKPVAISSNKPNPPAAPVLPPKRRRKPEAGLRLILLIDCSNSLKPVFSHITDAGRNLINSLKGDDEASIAVFADTDSIQAVQDFTSDKQKLIAAVDNLKSGGTQTALVDALYAVCDRAAEYAEDKGGRPIIVTITDGAESHSIHTRSNLYSLLRNEEVPVYTIGLVNWLENTPSPLFREGRRDTAIKLLTEIAQKSGGRTFFPKMLEELHENVREIATSLHKITEVDAELKFWKQIQLSGKPEDFESYLAKYPNGTFADSARASTTEGKIIHQELAAIVSQLVEATTKGKKSVLNRLLTDDHISSGEGKVYTKQQILAATKPDTSVKSFRIEKTELSFRNGKPVLTYSVKYDRQLDPVTAIFPTGFDHRTARFLNTISFTKQQGEWKAVEWYWSRMTN
jgi:Mg-chelatase subunit ChlD